MCTFMFAALRAVPRRTSAAALLEDVARQRLPRGATLAVDHGVDVRVRVLQGEAWITEAGSAIDLVLGAGESCPLTRPGRALIEVHGRGQLAFEPMVPGTVPRAIRLRTSPHAPWVVLFRGPGALARVAAGIGRAARALYRRAALALRIEARRRARRALQLRY